MPLVLRFMNDVIHISDFVNFPSCMGIQVAFICAFVRLFPQKACEKVHWNYSCSMCLYMLQVPGWEACKKQNQGEIRDEKE